jgi:hypothetical protein
MPFGGLLSLAGAGVGIGSSLAGLFGGSPASQVPTYSYANMGGADQGAFQGTQNLGQYNIGAQNLPQYQQIAQQMQLGNNPYAQQYLSGSQGVGQATTGAGAALTGGALGQLGNVQAIMNQGFDPQNALYNYTQNQNQQQNLAALGQSGIANTPYGQGVNDMANNQFNMNWQNNQLGREATAAGAAGGLLNNIGQNVNQGTSLMAQGVGLPYGAYTGIQNNAIGALNSAGGAGVQASQIPEQQVQDYLAYLGQGTQAQTANTNTANSVFNQQTQLGQNLGNSLSQLGNSWGKAFGGNSYGGNVGNYGQVANSYGLGAGTGGLSFPMF